MTIYRGTYYSASGCDSSARAGTSALVSWYLGAYKAQGAANLGTYACKRLGSGWSIHAERRAADLGTAPYGGADSSWGWSLANALRLNSAELGVQLIILGRKIWGCSYPDAGWRTYSGEYHGHFHVELTPTASRNLTAAKIQSTIGGTGGGLPVTGGGAMLPKQGDKSEVVNYWQWLMRDIGLDPGTIDGDYGPKTAAAVNAYRKRHNLGNITYISGWQAFTMQQEWIKKYAGARGPAGPAGAAGPTGPKGDPGVLTGTLNVVGGHLQVTTGEE